MRTPGTPRKDLFLAVLRNPTIMATLDLAGWDLLVRQARAARLLGRLAGVVQELGLGSHLPPEPRRHLEAAWTIAQRHQRVLQWEVACLAKLACQWDFPVVLLKGAAYQMAELPPARGRLLGDIDLMVPKAHLAEAERTLLDHGWEPLNTHPYDQRYYRAWMHELPPLLHPARQTVVDLHHTILPETGRLHPDAHKLFEAAVPLSTRPFYVLEPADMVLHSAAHMFQDGDLAGGIRDLVDLNDLLVHFGSRGGFWERLLTRAEEHQLQRPLFYAIRFTQRMLHTPIPEEIAMRIGGWGPKQPLGRLMDALVAHALDPSFPETSGVGNALARWLLYVRAHWLRMPPWLLVCHLSRKALRRWADLEPRPIVRPQLPDAPPER